MLAMALKPFGERSFVGLMKLPAALLTSPESGPDSSQIRCTIASTACASRMSTEWVLTVPPCLAVSSLAVASRTGPRRPQIHTSAPSSRYFVAISLPRPVPPPVTRMRLPLSSPSLNMRAPAFAPCWSAHSKRGEERQADREAEQRRADPRDGRKALLAGHVRDDDACRRCAGALAEEHGRGVERDGHRCVRGRDRHQPRLLRTVSREAADARGQHAG